MQKGRAWDTKGTNTIYYPLSFLIRRRLISATLLVTRESSLMLPQKREISFDRTDKKRTKRKHDRMTISNNSARGMTRRCARRHRINSHISACENPLKLHRNGSDDTEIPRRSQSAANNASRCIRSVPAFVTRALLRYALSISRAIRNPRGNISRVSHAVRRVRESRER